MVESNPIYYFMSYVKLLKSMNLDNIHTRGKCRFFHNDENAGGITKIYSSSTFSTAGNLENALMSDFKKERDRYVFPVIT